MICCWFVSLFGTVSSATKSAESSGSREHWEPGDVGCHPSREGVDADDFICEYEIRDTAQR